MSSDTAGSDTAARQLTLLAEQAGALRTGDFTLKSGRKSSLFFNMGAINEGPALAALGRLYAGAVRRTWPLPDGVDVLFGPAYKGISLAAVCTAVLAEEGIAVSFAYDRKEAKDHGEGGRLVGEVKGKKALLLDDVLTAGTAARQSVQLLRDAGAEVVGMLVALDRCEPAGATKPAMTARQLLEYELGVPVRALATLPELMQSLTARSSQPIPSQQHRP